MAYELRTLNLPKLSGFGLKAFTAAVENPAAQALLLGNLLESGGIPKLRRTIIPDAPTFYPLQQPGEGTEAGSLDFEAGPQPQDFPYRTLLDYARAYRAGSLSPVEAAEAVLAAVERDAQTTVPLRAFVAVSREDVLQQARAAAERIRAGQALSLLDGVPVAVKDEIDMRPYPTTVGTAFLGTAPAPEDASVVARLRAAGALLVGKTNMHEIGISPNGFNAHAGAVRNPYNVACDPGGSSSGSAAAVSAGIVPAAIGADGGGSIRIPAALCGIVGLKPTFGRVSEAGAAPLCWSVAHLGPLAASVEDAALIYAAIAGPDPRDPNSLVQPAPRIDGWNRTDLSGLRLGIYREWFEHASPEIVSTCKQMVECFRAAGAEICEVNLPELDEMRIAHAVTILSEMAACMRAYRSHRREQGLSVRLSLVLGEALTSNDYIQAQRMRTRALAIFRQAFTRVDAILTPGTALTAQPIPTGSLPAGWSDLGTDTEMMRYVYPGNLTGLPGISFPVGYDSRGMPVSMQAIGRHWEEHLLLRLAYTAEQHTQRRLPERAYKIF